MVKEEFIWITGGDKGYLPMIEVLAKSLLKYSKYKLIVYGFNCDSNINLSNVINKRIDYKTKNKVISKGENDLKNKDYSIYFAKYLASLDSLNENYEKFAWIDGDAFATKNIDDSLNYLDNLKDHPLFMRYWHKDIYNWRTHYGIKLEGHYGDELAGLKNIIRNPNQLIIATGFYFYDDNSREFFNKCLKWNKELDKHSVKIYVDDNAFSEERVANCILWEEGKIDYLPITWNNYYSSDDEIEVNTYYLEKGWDIMYDSYNKKPLFIHGPDPSVMKKDGDTLNKAYLDYNATRLMIIAHPDDELIFGGAELIKYGKYYKVVLVSNPENKDRIKEFENVMNKLNVGSWEILGYEDTLYPIQTYDKIDTIINSRKWNKIVTHNPIGEYGHPQHKLIFDRVKSLTDDFWIFGKSPERLPDDVLEKKMKLLKLYKSEQSIINQILECNGRWFISNNLNTNYIEHEYISWYQPERDKTPYINCYDK